MTSWCQSNMQRTDMEKLRAHAQFVSRTSRELSRKFAKRRAPRSQHDGPAGTSSRLSHCVTSWWRRCSCSSSSAGERTPQPGKPLQRLTAATRCAPSCPQTQTHQSQVGELQAALDASRRQLASLEGQLREAFANAAVDAGALEQLREVSLCCLCAGSCRSSGTGKCRSGGAGSEWRGSAAAGGAPGRRRKVRDRHASRASSRLLQMGR